MALAPMSTRSAAEVILAEAFAAGRLPERPPAGVLARIADVVRPVVAARPVRRTRKRLEARE